MQELNDPNLFILELAVSVLMSHDIEDIIALLEGRPTIIEDVSHADELVKNEIGHQWSV